MNREEQLVAIRQKCIGANPDKEFIIWACEGCQTVYGEYVNGCPKCWDENLEREDNLIKYPNRAVTARECPVRLADVLLATKKEWATMLSPGGGLMDGKPPREILPEGLRLYQIVRKWNLRADDLTLQSDPTISFLYDLLYANS